MKTKTFRILLFVIIALISFFVASKVFGATFTLYNATSTYESPPPPYFIFTTYYRYSNSNCGEGDDFRCASAWSFNYSGANSYVNEMVYGLADAGSGHTGYQAGIGLYIYSKINNTDPEAGTLIAHNASTTAYMNIYAIGSQEEVTFSTSTMISDSVMTTGDYWLVLKKVSSEYNGELKGMLVSSSNSQTMYIIKKNTAWNGSYESYNHTNQPYVILDLTQSNTTHITPILPSNTATTTYTNYPVRFQAEYTLYADEGYDKIRLRIGSTGTSTLAYVLYYNIPVAVTGDATSTFTYDLNGMRNGSYIVTWYFTGSAGTSYQSGSTDFIVDIPDNAVISTSTPTAVISPFEPFTTSTIGFIALNVCEWDGIFASTTLSNMVCYAKNYIFDMVNTAIEIFDTGITLIINGASNVFPLSTFVAINNDIQAAQATTTETGYNIVLSGTASGFLGGVGRQYTILTSTTTNWIEEATGFDYRTIFDYIFYALAGLLVFETAIITVKIFTGRSGNSVEKK